MARFSGLTPAEREEVRTRWRNTGGVVNGDFALEIWDALAAAEAELERYKAVAEAARKVVWYDKSDIKAWLEWTLRVNTLQKALNALAALDEDEA